MPGRDFFLVKPFVKQLNEWIKSRKSGKCKILKKPTQSAKAQQKESRRTSSVPSQRPERGCELGYSRHQSDPVTLEELGRNGSFPVEDMFRVNEVQYGVKSTYRFELYTTPLKPVRSGIANSLHTDSAPGGGYRHCTVKDMHKAKFTAGAQLAAESAASRRPDNENSAQARGEAVSASSSGGDLALVAGSAPCPPRASHGSVDTKRRRDELASQDYVSQHIDNQTRNSFFDLSSVGSDKAVPVRGNVEFGKGFRFNTLDVMAPILAMS